MTRTHIVRTAGALALSATLAAPAAAQLPATPPALAPAPSVRPPVPETRALSNGLQVQYVRMAELPVVQALLVVRGAGSAADPAGLPGLASFTATMLDEGAGGKDAIALADALDFLGASLTTGAAWDNATVGLYVLRRNFERALPLMADVVLRPDFPENEVQRLREERVVNLTRARDEAGAIAANAFQSLVFGADHPYGRFATVEGTRTLDRAGVAGFHRATYRPDRATLILVGDVDPAAMHPMLERAFGGWRSDDAAAAAIGTATPPRIERTTVFLVDKPGAAQSEIRIGHPGVARNHPDYYPLMVMNTILGASFTSRLNTNLREVHGYTYGAGSGYAMRAQAGPFTAQAAVQTAKTDSALIEFFKELNRIRTEPVPAAELEKAKAYLALGFPEALETTSSVAAQLAGLVTYDIPPTFFGEYVQRIMGVTAADVQRVANAHVRPANAVVVVVGDRATIEAAVRAANIGPVEIRPVEEFVR